MHGIPLVLDQSLFFSLTKLPNQGVPFEGTIIDDWKFDYLSHDARRMVCNDQADMIGKFLVGSLTFEGIYVLIPLSSYGIVTPTGSFDF